LFLLELFLRLYENEKIIRNENKFNEKKRAISDYTILCIGDSFTDGVGAPYGEGFPEHLEHLLLNNKKSIAVFNKGMPGANTFQVLKKTKFFLENIRPDILIVRIGSNNSSNRSGFSDYVERRDPFLGYYRRSRDSFYEIIYLFKTFRFFNYYAHRFFLKKTRERSIVNRMKFENDFFKKKSEIFKLAKGKIIEDMPIKDVKVLNKKIDEKMLEYYHPSLYTLKGAIVLKLYNSEDKAADAFIKGVEKDETGFLNSNIYRLKYLMDKSKNNKLKERINVFLKKWIAENPRDKPRLASRTTIREWIKDDLDLIINLAKKRKIEIIFHSYPPHAVIYKKWVNSTLQQVANSRGVHFVNVEKYFFNLKRKGVDIKKYYADDDDHLNSKGYKINAQLLYDYIISRKLLSLK